MKRIVVIWNLVSKQLIVLSLVLTPFIPLNLVAQSFPVSQGNGYFQPGGIGMPSGEMPANGNQLGTVYAPFSPYSPTQLPQGNNPVLYGPGGNPIGGLPMGNGSIVLLSLVVAYVLFRLVQTRFNRKARVY